MILSRIQESTSFSSMINFEIIDEMMITGSIRKSSEYFPEEERSKQPSLFSIIRKIITIFTHEKAGQLGLYGAFGYDLAFQFENTIKLTKERNLQQNDIILYLPDEIFVYDNIKKDGWKISYEFLDRYTQKTTMGLFRTIVEDVFSPANETVLSTFQLRDNLPGDYAKWVDKAKEQFKVGNLFEVVLSQIFRAKMNDLPSTIFKR
jgi:anthranilate synthase